MDKKRIRKEAAEHLGFGIPKQQVYDLLQAAHPDAKPRKMAEVVRFLPSLLARERYGAVHRLLLILIVIYGALRVLRPMLEPDFSWEISYRLISLAPIATVLLGWSILRWQGQVFEWVGWINVLSVGTLIAALRDWQQGSGDPWNTALSMLSVGIGALALYLAHRVFTKPKVEKDPMGTAPPRYVFPEEGMP